MQNNNNSTDFELLAKGNRVSIQGYFKPEEWTDNKGVKHNRIIMVAKSINAADDKPEGNTKKEA